MILSVAPETYADGSKGPEVWVSVEAHIDSFSASLASCVARSDWDRFIVDLSRLEKARRGEAVLVSAFAAELRLRIYSKDHAGHIAVEGRFSRVDVTEEPVLEFTGLELEPDRLPLLLQELRVAGLAV
jgi:hypothetical protein